MLDCVITHGTVIDGSGAPRRAADVGIRDGRIAAVGTIDEPAHRTIDARGKIVAPGCIDIHTHYDAQAFWDRTLSPSLYHGVTTVVGGNCGFSIAPLAPEAADYLKRMLARVEGMPLEALEAGVPWDWRTTEEYLSRLDGRLAINAGFLVGHSALRRIVMGADAVGKRATDAQIEQMVALLHESLGAGGLGFSSSTAQTHNDGNGQPVPSRSASHGELVALAAAVRAHPGTTLELVPTVGPLTDEHRDLMADMSRAADRPLNWNVLMVTALAPDFHERQLQASDYAAARGGRVVALTLPQVMTLRLNLISGFVLDALPGWSGTLALPLAERKRALADPAVRRRLAEGAASDEAGALGFIATWENMTVDETFAPANAYCKGKRIGDIAKQVGKTPFDTFLDLALSDDLRTSFMPYLPGDDDASWALRASVWRDPRTVIGASDAGAHLDMIDTFTCSTSLLGPAVRDRALLTLEEAVQHLTDVPARLYGLRERGRLQASWHADIVVFDPERVGPGPVHTRNDLPTGAARLFAEAEGIEHVFVGGREVVRGKEFTETYPGTILRSGRDTDTVTVSS